MTLFYCSNVLVMCLFLYGKCVNRQGVWASAMASIHLDFVLTVAAGLAPLALLSPVDLPSSQSEGKTEALDKRAEPGYVAVVQTLCLSLEEGILALGSLGLLGMGSGLLG